MQNRKTKTNTNSSSDPNRYRRRCPDPNAMIQKFIHYMVTATFAIADCHRFVGVFMKLTTIDLCSFCITAVIYFAVKYGVHL